MANAIGNSPTYTCPSGIARVGPTGSCPAIPITIEEIQPVYYSSYFSSPTVVDPFDDGILHTLSHAPTKFYINSSIVRIVTVCSTTSADTISASPPPSSGLGSSLSSNGLESGSTTAPSTTPTLFIGEGLPQGTVFDLPDEDFLFLAYTPITPPQDQARNIYRRQAAPSPLTTPVRTTNLTLISGSLIEIGQNNCDDSTPLLLRNGELVYYDLRIGLQSRVKSSVLGFTEPRPADYVTTLFRLENGVLRWNPAVSSPETEASFYLCDGPLFVGFGTVPPVRGCTQVLAGAIAGSACIDRVRQSRAINPEFVAPVPRTTLKSSTPAFVTSATTAILSQTSLVQITAESHAPGTTNTSMNKSPVTVPSSVQSIPTTRPRSTTTQPSMSSYASPVSTIATPSSLTSTTTITDARTATTELSTSSSASSTIVPVNEVYAAPNGKVFDVYYEHDYPYADPIGGPEMAIQDLSDYHDCLNTCSAVSMCIGLRWVDAVEFYPHTLCFLLDGLVKDPPGPAPSSVKAARLVFSPPLLSLSSTSDSATTQLSSSTSSGTAPTPSPNPLGQRYMAANGKTFNIYYSHWYSNGDFEVMRDLADLQACLDACSASSTCIAVDWNDTYYTYTLCYLFSTLSTELSPYNNYDTARLVQ